MEVIMTYFKVLSQNLPGGIEKTNKTTVRTASLWADIQTWDLPYMKQVC
jgi:hypothetical protein